MGLQVKLELDDDMTKKKKASRIVKIDQIAPFAYSKYQSIQNKISRREATS